MAENREVSFILRVKDAASAVLKDIQGSVDKTVEKMFNFKDILHELTVAAGVFSLAEVTKQIIELGVESDKTFRQIAANLPTFTQGIGELKEGIEQLAQASGRSVEAMEQSAAAIAKLGVTSAEDLQQQLTAATELADATGNSVDDMATLLIQVRREFHLTGDQALDTAAKIASVAQGKIGVGELMSAFQAATPIFLKFGIDVDTGTKALGALVSAGYTTSRAIRGELGQLDAEGIREYAARTTIAADATEQLAKRAEHVEQSAAAAAQRIKNEFSIALDNLGTKLLPTVTTGLQGLLNLIEQIKNKDLSGIFGGVGGSEDPFVAFKRGLDPAGPFGHGNHGASGTFGGEEGSGSGTPAPHIMTAAEKKAIEDAAAAIQKLSEEADKLAATSEAAAPKSEQFLDSITAWSEKALAAGMSTAEFEEKLSALNATLASLRADEALKRLEDQSKATNETFGKLSDAMAKFGGDASDKAQVEFDALVAKLKEGAKQFRDDSDATIEFEQRLAALREAFSRYQATLTEVAEVQKNLDAAQRDMADTTLSDTDRWNKLDVEWRQALADEQRLNAEAANGAGTEEDKQRLQQLQKVREALKQIGAAMDEIQGKQQDSTSQVVQIAEKWATVARTIIDAAQALGKMGSAAASVANSAVNLGEGITRIVASGGTDIGGWTESIASLGNLVKGISDMGHASSEAKQRAAELSAQINGMFLGLQQQISPTGGGSLAEQIANAQQQYETNRNTIERQEGGKANQTQREKDLDKLDALETQYIEHLKEEFAEKEKELQEDYRVRALRAQGLDAEADALEFAEKQEREREQAVKDGADADTLAALAAAQAAEATAFAAQQQQKAAESALSAATSYADQYDKIHGVTDPLQQFSDKAKAYSSAGGSLGAILGQFNLDALSPADLAKLNQEFGDLFDKLHDSPDSVDLAGLSIQDLITALLDLSDAAKTAGNTAKAAANAWAETTNTLSDFFDVNQTSSVDQINPTAQSLGIDLGGGNFDLTTQQGRNAAVAYLTNLFNSTPPADPMRHNLRTVIDMIRNLPPLETGSSIGVAGSSSLGGVGGGSTAALSAGFQSITTTQADRLADIDLRQLNVLIDVRDILKDIKSLSTPHVQPPQLPSGTAGSAPQVVAPGAGGGGGSGVTVNVNVGGITVGAGADVSSAQQISAELARQINIALTRSLVQQAILRGTIDVAAPFAG